MQIRLSTIFLSASLAVVSLGWLFEKRSCAARERALILENNATLKIASVSNFNLVYSEFDSLDAVEFTDERRDRLLFGVVWLANTSTKSQEDSALRAAVRSFDLLKFENAEQFFDELRGKDEVLERLGDTVILRDSQTLNPSLVGFVDRVVAVHHKLISGQKGRTRGGQR